MVIMCACVNETAQDVFVTPVTLDTETSEYLYKPGTYTGTAQGYSGEITVSVKVNESQILSISIDSYSDNNYQKQIVTKVLVEEEEDSTSEESTEESSEESSAENKDERDEPQYKEVISYQTVEVYGMMDSVINEVISTQSLDVSLDFMTGATVSCSALLSAIQNALSSAMLK